MATDANARRFSVLVVSDNRKAADTLAVLLRRKGHSARVAYGGEQALEFVRDWRPDVAILDLDMDGVSGVELATRMRNGVAGPIMLVAVTRVGANGEVAPMNASGFDHVFLKPADLNELLGLLEAHACGRPLA